MARAPEGYGSHPLPGFRYVRDARVLGAVHVGLRHESGSRVVMPAQGVLSLGERPERIAVVAEVAAYAAEHAGYHLVDDIAALPDRTLLKRAEVDEVRAVYRRATIYAAPAAGLIVKAFDKAPNREAVAQFAVMTALQQALLDAATDEPVPLRGPEQYALVQPPAGKHRTIVMEAVPGRQLYDVLGELPEVRARELVARQALSRMVKPVLEAAVARQVPAALLPYVNDLTGGAEGGLYTNLIVAEPERLSYPETADEVRELIRSGTIIDQPRYLPEIAAWGWRQGMGRISRLLNR